MSAEAFDSIAFTRRHVVRLTDGREYSIEAVDFEWREVKYYSESDFPHWVKLKRIAAVL